MNLAGFVVANALRSRRRSLLTLLSIAFSIFLMTTLEGLLRHIEAFPTKTGGESRLVCRNRASFLSRIPLAYLEKIRAVRGVQAATPYCYFGGRYKDAQSQQSFVQFAVDPEALRTVIPEIEPVDPKTGKPSAERYREFAADKSGAMASVDLFARFGWKLGEKVVLQGILYPFDVELTLRAAYVAKPGAEGNLLYFHYDYFDERAARAATMTAVMLRASSVDAVPGVVERIDGAFANSSQETLTEAEQALRARVIGMLGNVEFFVRSIGTAIAFAMLMVAANTASMMARERRTEIAVLKSLGFTPAWAVGLFCSETTLLALAGASLGIAGSFLCGPIVRALVHDTQLARMLGGYQLSPAVALATLAIGGSVGLLAGLVPACRAAGRPIAETLGRAA